MPGSWHREAPSRPAPSSSSSTFSAGSWPASSAFSTVSSSCWALRVLPYRVFPLLKHTVPNGQGPRVVLVVEMDDHRTDPPGQGSPLPHGDIAPTKTFRSSRNRAAASAPDPARPAVVYAESRGQGITWAKPSSPEARVAVGFGTLQSAKPPDHAHRQNTRERDAPAYEEAVAIPAAILAPLRRWMRLRGRVSMIRSKRRLTTR
jgi:hypothetical protein